MMIFPQNRQNICAFREKICAFLRENLSSLHFTNPLYFETP